MSAVVTLSQCTNEKKTLHNERETIVPNFTKSDHSITYFVSDTADTRGAPDVEESLGSPL